MEKRKDGYRYYRRNNSKVYLQPDWDVNIMTIYKMKCF